LKQVYSGVCCSMQTGHSTILQAMLSIMTQGTG